MAVLSNPEIFANISGQKGTPGNWQKHTHRNSYQEILNHSICRRLVTNLHGPDLGVGNVTVGFLGKLKHRY